MTSDVLLEGMNLKFTYKNNYSFMDWFLPVFMILAQYSINGFSNIGTIALIIYAGMRFLRGGDILYIHKYLLIFIGYVSLLQIINMIRLNSLSIADINNVIMPWIILFIIAVTISTIHPQNLYKSYALIGSVAMIIMYYQAIGLIFFNIPAVPVTILPVQREDYHFWGFFEGHRPSSLFTEPQAYASFMIPLLILAIKKKKNLFSALISFSILLSTSTFGILFVGIVYAYFVFIEPSKLHKKLFLLLLIFSTVYLFIKLPLFEFAYNKLVNTKIANNIRITRGFEIFGTFNMTNMLLGIGGNQQTYVMNNLNLFPWAYNYYSKNDQLALLGYSTTMAGTLIKYGIFAGMLFLLMFFKMYKNEDKNMRAVLVTIIGASFVQTILFNAWFILYYIFYLGCCDKKGHRNNYYLIKFRS